MRRFLTQLIYLLFIFSWIAGCAARIQTIAEIKTMMRDELSHQYIPNQTLVQHALELQIDLAVIAVLGKFPASEYESIDLDQFATETELEGIMLSEVQNINEAAGIFRYVSILTFVEENIIQDLHEKLLYLTLKRIGLETLTQRFLRATGFASQKAFLGFVEERLQQKLCTQFAQGIRTKYPATSQGKRDEELGVMQTDLLNASFPMAKEILQERRIELSRPKPVIIARAIPPTNPKLTDLKDALPRLQDRLRALSIKLGQLKGNRH